MARLGNYRSTTEAPITGPQLGFLKSLTADLFTLTETITGEPYPNQDAALALLETLTKREASARITELKGDILPVMRGTVRAQGYAAQTVERPASAPAPVELDTDGIYVIAGAYYRVKRSQSSGNLYALCLNTASRRWEYAPGMVRQITPDTRITAEHAARLPFSWCIRCARELSREDSIARRMGPVCYAKSVG